MMLMMACVATSGVAAAEVLDGQQLGPGSQLPWFTAASLAGVVSGVSQVLAEQPFDLLKTRLQSTAFSSEASAITLLRTTIRAEGPRALMLGVAPRLLTYPLVKLSLFSLYERIHARTHSTVIAGALAGLVNTVVACPADVVKSRLQMRRLECAVAPTRLLRADGLRVHLFRGLAPLMLRDAVGYALLFTVYDEGKRLKALRVVPSWVLGGLAGTSFYAATMPIDRVKVMMQTSARSLRSCCSELCRQDGSMLRALYRGSGPTLARTFVGQAVALTVYDALMSSHPVAGEKSR